MLRKLFDAFPYNPLFMNVVDNNGNIGIMKLEKTYKDDNLAAKCNPDENGCAILDPLVSNRRDAFAHTCEECEYYGRTHSWLNMHKK